MSNKRYDTVYEPVVLDVTVNDWLYQVVTISVSPGRVVSITLIERGQPREQAIRQALEHLAYING